MDSKVKAQKNETYGRYLIADKDIKAGEVILREKPIVLGPQIQAVHLCFKCSQLLKYKLQICQECSVATVCSSECEGKGHLNECPVLKESGLRPSDIICSPQIVLPLRCLLLRKCNKSAWETFMELEPHLEKRKGTGIWKTHQKNVVEVLESLGQLSKADIEENIVQKICGILDVNVFELRPPNVSGSTTNPSDCIRGLYLNASLMSHDCIGNTLLSVDDDFEMTVTASVDVSVGQMIFFNYGNTLQGTYNRRLHLKQGKYFDCDCRRCSDPRELGTYLSAIRCRKCWKGYVVPVTPLSDTFETAWNCEMCDTTYMGVLIKSTINAVLDLIQGLDPDNAVEAEKLLRKLYLTLAPRHYLILELKQNMIAMYEKSLFTDKAMERKIVLCKDVIDVLKAIEPGISRLQAIALYQLHAAQVNLANKSYQCRDMNPEKYLESLLEAETNLTAAVKLLVYEPMNSPEGRLARQALEELKILRNMIHQTKNIVGTKISDGENILRFVTSGKN